MTIFEKNYQQGCCWQIVFCFGGAHDHFCCAGIGRDRAGSGCSPRLRAPLSRHRSGGCGLESGRDRAAGCSPRLRAPLSRHRCGLESGGIGRDRAGSGGIRRDRAGSGGIGLQHPHHTAFSSGCVRKSKIPPPKTRNFMDMEGFPAKKTEIPPKVWR